MAFKFPFFGRKDKKEKEKKDEKPVFAFEENLSPLSLANKAYSHIEKLSDLTDRFAASSKARMAAKNIAALFENYSEDVSFHEFDADPKVAFLWTKICPILLIISTVFLLVGLPYLTFLINAINSLIILYDSIFARGIFSRFIKKEKGENVRATIRPEGNEENIVIISSHHDAALLYNRKDHLRDIYLPLATVIYIAVLSLFLILYEALNSTLFRFNFPSLFPFIFIAVAIALSIVSFKLFSVFSNEISPAVGDNLSSVGVSIALAEYFSKRRLKHTRVDFISFDAEECGCQGSSAYYKENKYSEETVVINLDGLYKSEDLAVLTSDLNGFVSLDESLSSDLVNIALDMGYKIKKGKLTLFAGATDASSAAKNGIRATTITAMAGCDTPAHTKDDTIDKIDIKTLEEVIAIVIKFIESKDKKKDERKIENDSLLDAKKYKISLLD